MCWVATRDVLCRYFIGVALDWRPSTPFKIDLLTPQTPPTPSCHHLAPSRPQSLLRLFMYFVLRNPFDRPPSDPPIVHRFQSFRYPFAAGQRRTPRTDTLSSPWRSDPAGARRIPHGCPWQSKHRQRRCNCEQQGPGIDAQDIPGRRQQAHPKETVRFTECET